MNSTFLKSIICINFSCFVIIGIAQEEFCTASYYHSKFEGRGTSNGEVFRQNKFTCAHKSLPFGTWLKVTCIKNNNVVYVRVNDRLPKSSKRSIDLAFVAAEELNFVRSGITQVTMEIVSENSVPEHFRSPIELKTKSQKR